MKEYVSEETEGKEECIRILVGKPEGKSTLGRPRRRWKDNATRSSWKN
jgi:hypothetical protein